MCKEMTEVVRDSLRQLVSREGTCKPGDWKEVKGKNTIKWSNYSLEVIDEMEVIKVEKHSRGDKFTMFVKLFVEDGMVQLLKRGNSYYLVNTEGYDYPRYIMRLIGYRR